MGFLPGHDVLPNSRVPHNMLLVAVGELSCTVVVLSKTGPTDMSHNHGPGHLSLSLCIRFFRTLGPEPRSRTYF